MQQAVADGIGQGRVADIGMPVTDGALAGDDGGAGLVAVFDDLQQVPAFPVGGRGKQKIVDDEQLRLGQPGQASSGVSRLPGPAAGSQTVGAPAGKGRYSRPGRRSCPGRRRYMTCRCRWGR